MATLKRERGDQHCFLCFQPGTKSCPHCHLVQFCSEEHENLHRVEGECLPYRIGFIKNKGRVLFATRDIKPLELIMVDPGSVVGPNYRSIKVCLECLKPIDGNGLACPGCRFPLCADSCLHGPRHQAECSVLARNTDRAMKINSGDISAGYAHICPLRLLLLQDKREDSWERTNHLMDHLTEKGVHPKEWKWYQTEIIDYLRNTLNLADKYSQAQIERAIGLLNVNAVCLQFSRIQGCPSTEVGKGVYPIFAMMSHECICNARYVVDPDSFNMFVRARVHIKAGEELTVQYLSALKGNLPRRIRIKEEWYFDCCCKRCSDNTECGSYISVVKCFSCGVGNLLPVTALDTLAQWACSRCPGSFPPDKIELLVQEIETEFDTIMDSSEFWQFQTFIEKYSGTILHANHWILTTARRNLIQYLCYSQEAAQLDITLEERTKICHEFWTVLSKVDPGWSELSMFALRELHFAKLALLQKDYARGLLPLVEFSVKSRNSIDALEKVSAQRKFLNCSQQRD